MTDRGPDWLEPSASERRMAENVDLILGLLREQREDQRRTNNVLAELSVDMAGVRRMVDGQAEGIAAMRADQAQIFDRLRLVEATAARVPHIDAEVGNINTRIRALEVEGAGTRMVAGGVTSVAKEVLKWGLGLATGFLLAWITHH